MHGFILHNKYCKKSITEFPCLLENPENSLIYLSKISKISRTWKVLENEIGPGKSWHCIGGSN